MDVATAAGQVENVWLDMDLRSVRTPGTALLLGEDGEQEATTAELIEMVRDRWNISIINLLNVISAHMWQTIANLS